LHVFASLGHVDRVFLTPILVAFNASTLIQVMIHWSTPLDVCLQLALCLFTFGVHILIGLDWIVQVSSLNALSFHGMRLLLSWASRYWQCCLPDIHISYVLAVSRSVVVISARETICNRKLLESFLFILADTGCVCKMYCISRLALYVALSIYVSFCLKKKWILHILLRRMIYVEDVRNYVDTTSNFLITIIH
jgi:hypothetical protein